MQVSGNGAVSGVAYPTNATGGSPSLFTGQLSGINLSIQGLVNSCTGAVPGNTGTGTVQNGAVNGTLAGNPCHGPGTFTGSLGVCSIPAPPPAASSVGFNIQLTKGPGSFTASLQNETLTADGNYN